MADSGEEQALAPQNALAALLPPSAFPFSFSMQIFTSLKFQSHGSPQQPVRQMCPARASISSAALGPQLLTG
jgi:hypothetical protein